VIDEYLGPEEPKRLDELEERYYLMRRNDVVPNSAQK